jgi:60 kDa SS-A/Ro ribonucleoprotein
MAKFASNSAVARKSPAKSVKTTNAAGGPGYTQSAKLELVSLLLTCFVKDSAYRDENATLLRVKELIGKVDPLFAAKAAVFARTEFGMRSITHTVAGEIAKSVKGATWTRGFYNKVVHRPDDVTEILAYYMTNYGKPIPNALKRGLGAALGRFNDYQIAKYRRDGAEFKLVDAVNLLYGTKSRPIRKDGAEWKDGQLSPTLGKLVRNELAPADTWETKLSKAGQSDETEVSVDEAKAEAWKNLLSEKKLGYLALLRNIRNIMQADASLKDELAAQLVNRAAIKKSLVFPFQIKTAYDVAAGLPDNRKVLRALDDAIDLSLDNVPKFEGDSVVILDVSGSMTSVAVIASIFAAVLVKAWDADLVKFDDSASYIDNLNTKDSTMTLAGKLHYSGGGTNMPSAINALRKKYERIVILSDMQTWVNGQSVVGPFNDYKRRFSAKPRVYSFDLQNYGTMAFPQEDVYALAGFSDKVFDLMKHLEQDRNAMVNRIESISFE